MTHTIDHAIFRVAGVLEVPVLIAALVALAYVLVESGAFLVELRNRRRRRPGALSDATTHARRAIAAGDRNAAAAALRPLGHSEAMDHALAQLAGYAGGSSADALMAKALADFDFGSQKRLERTRLLVRVGPALGLMGTLIPLSPALTGLARGDTQKLSDNLRIAFSVTVLGLLIGAVAYGLSLVRDRIYGQDLSDLELVAALLSEPFEEAA